MFRTPYCIGEKKWSQQKITFECSFIAQNPFQTILEHGKTLKHFRKFFNFLYVSNPILHRWKKWSQQKITFECSLIAQNPFQTILEHGKTLKHLRKIFNFLYVSNPILHRWKKMKSTKNHFWVLFHSAKSISDHFRTWNNFETFSKIF